jgi:superfamily II DNA or RNA helicase
MELEHTPLLTNSISISLLVTIAIGLKSTDPAIRKQLPSSWKRTQALILCPPGLIDNWIEEFRIWTPQPFKDYLISLQAIRSTTQDSAKRTNDRLRQISDWYETGGILIISYELFRTLVKNEPTKTRPAALNLLQKNKLDRELLGGPDIIIADEAHKMKNPTSSISEAASQFRSRSRIALTGSPLANNLEEYFAMIDWVAPKYLGDIVEFRAKYVEPIKDGLYADSSSYEKRRALTKLSILNKNIDPKINRADITTMKNEMPPKTEFLITVALTKVQTDAYNIFTNAHLHGTGDVTQTRLFSWLKLMLLICNHPHCFRQRLLEKPKASKGAAASRRNSTDEMSGMSDSDIEISHPSAPASTGMSQELIQQMLSLLEAEPDLKSPYMSNKAVILTHIVRQSMKAGDKVLVFSQSIPTINYLEWLCETHLDVRTARLTGETVMSTRQGSAKSFNKAGSLKHVYLISTKAGGLGLNLYGANRVVIFDFDFNPTWEEQAVGRAYRFGQKKPVYVYRLKAGGTFEDIIEMKTVFKTQLASRVVDKKNPIRFASKSAKDYLFPPKQLQQKDVDQFRGNDPEVLDKILDMELSLIRALDLTETFHKEDDEKLTEQEEQMVQTELKGELLRRDDPDAYGEWVKARQQEEMSKRLNDLQQPTNLQGSVAAQLGGLGPSMQMASRPSPSLPRPPTNFQAARVPARMQAVSGYTGPYTNPLQPLPRSASHQQGSTQPNLISATTISSTDPPPSLPTPLTALPLTSDEGKGKASDVPDTGVQRSVATSLTINGPETDEMEGIENEDQSPPDDQDAAERTKWQEQRDKLAARTTTPLYIPLSTEQPRLHENALDRAFAANEHVVHPPRDSEEWKAMKKGGFNVWKGPFKKRMESYDKARYGPKEYSAELWRSYGNPLEIHWCAQKGQEEQEMREVEKQQRGVERGPSSSPYFRRSNQEERVEEQGTPAGEERVQPGPEESGESGSGDGVESTGRSVIDGKGM